MGKEILVTGSSRGIGKEIALYLAENGFDIVLHCRNNLQQAQEVQKLIQKTGHKSRILQFDVKDRKKSFEALENDIKQNGVYFGVVLNAGIARDNVFPIMTETEWDDVIDTNLGSFYNVLKPVIMPMIEERVKGRIECQYPERRRNPETTDPVNPDRRTLWRYQTKRRIFWCCAKRRHSNG